MSARAGGIPRYRSFTGPALLRQGFRPFFFGAGLWALVAMALWLGALAGHLVLPSAFDPLAWHAHELLFGFVVAAMAGFLLTAIPNWTGRMPLQGWWLGALAGTWLAGRLAVLGSAWIGPAAAAVLDLAFLALLLGVVVREIAAGHNWRNLPMPAALAALLIANVLTHAEILGIAATGAHGRRLCDRDHARPDRPGRRAHHPELYLKKRGETALPARFGALDRLALALLLAALIVWVIAPETGIAGAALLAAGLATLVRLARWRGHRTLAEPLVWSLHLGFSWLPVGLLLTGASALVPPSCRRPGCTRSRPVPWAA